MPRPALRHFPSLQRHHASPPSSPDELPSPPPVRPLALLPSLYNRSIVNLDDDTALRRVHTFVRAIYAVLNHLDRFLDDGIKEEAIQIAWDTGARMVIESISRRDIEEYVHHRRNDESHLGSLWRIMEQLNRMERVISCYLYFTECDLNDHSALVKDFWTKQVGMRPPEPLPTILLGFVRTLAVDIHSRCHRLPSAESKTWVFLDEANTPHSNHVTFQTTNDQQNFITSRILCALHYKASTPFSKASHKQAWDFIEDPVLPLERFYDENPMQVATFADWRLLIAFSWTSSVTVELLQKLKTASRQAIQMQHSLCHRHRDQIFRAPISHRQLAIYGPTLRQIE